MAICNACRYCEGFCAVFPAMELRRSFSSGDLSYLANLCHDCRGCYYACQYAPPHEFALNLPQALARVRSETYAEYAWPRQLAGLFQRNGTIVSLLTSLGIALVFVLTAALRSSAILYSPHRGPEAFYAVIPKSVMIAVGGATFAFAMLALAMGFLNFWRDTGGGPVMQARSLLRAISDVLTLRHLGGGGYGCNNRDEAYSQTRRYAHQTMFYGFLLCFASTCVAGFYVPGTMWSHRTHLDAGLKCETCHGDVTQMDAMTSVKSVTSMGGCMGCHERHKAKDTCVTCHPAWDIGIASRLTPLQAQPPQAYTSAQNLNQDVPDTLVPLPPPVQPIPFSHKTHAPLGLQCDGCHGTPNAAGLMALPDAGMCMTCHANIAKDKPGIQKLAEFEKSKKPIPWVQVYKVPHHILGWAAPYPFFSIPVLLGMAGGIGMMIGTAWLVAVKVRSDSAPAAKDLLGSDYALLALLFLSAATGLLLLVWRDTRAMGILLALHLGVILSFFLTLPYSKFVHGIYRSAALLRHAAEHGTESYHYPAHGHTNGG